MGTAFERSAGFGMVVVANSIAASERVDEGAPFLPVQRVFLPGHCRPVRLIASLAACMALAAVTAAVALSRRGTAVSLGSKTSGADGLAVTLAAVDDERVLKVLIKQQRDKFP